jgi:hypothetical protein
LLCIFHFLGRGSFRSFHLNFPIITALTQNLAQLSCYFHYFVQSEINKIGNLDDIV